MSNVTLSELPRSTARSGVIDFHNHHVPERFELTAAKAAPPSQRARWEALARKLPDENLLLSDIRDGELSARVVNIPANLIADADGHVPHETIVAMNDELAALVARHPAAFTAWRRSMPTTATGLPVRPNAPSASLACAACSSIAPAATC